MTKLLVDEHNRRQYSLIEFEAMDRDTFLKLRERNRSSLEQRMAAEWGESEEMLQRRETALKTFDEATSLLMEHFPKITIWSGFVRKPPCWSSSD